MFLKIIFVLKGSGRLEMNNMILEYFGFQYCWDISVKFYQNV